MDAERLQELAKGHHAVTMFFLFLSTKAFTSFGSTASCKAVLGGFRDLAGVFRIEGREEVVDGSGQ